MAVLVWLHCTDATGTRTVPHGRRGSRGVVAGEHADDGVVALLLVDGVDGVQGSGDWIDVPRVPGVVVVNVGGCVVCWTDDLDVCTLHRVLTAGRARRC